MSENSFMDSIFDGIFSFHGPGAGHDLQDFSIEALDPPVSLPSWNGTDQDRLSGSIDQQRLPESLAGPSSEVSHSIDTPDAQILPHEWGHWSRETKCLFSNIPALHNDLVLGCDHEAHSVIGVLNCAPEQDSHIDNRYGTMTGQHAHSETSLQTIFQVDGILRRNKAAVCSLKERLACSCAHEPHIAMLYVAIVAKILTGYQAVASQICSTASLTDGSQLSRFTIHESRSRSLTSRAPSALLRVGSFEPDDIDQATLRRQLLLMELSKVGGVIGQMLSNFDGPAQLTMGWYRSACMAMMQNLQITRSVVNGFQGFHNPHARFLQ